MLGTSQNEKEDCFNSTLVNKDDERGISKPFEYF